MDHIRILSYFVIFIIGIWTFFNINHQSKNYPDRFLSPIITYILFFNLMILVNAATIYSCANILPNMMLYRSSFYPVILSPIYHISVWGMIISLLYIQMGFQGKSNSRKFNLLVILIFILLGTFYVVTNIMFNFRIISHHMIRIYVYLNYSSIALLLIIFVWMFLYGLLKIKGLKRRMVLGFALFHLVWIILFFVTYPFDTIEQVIPNLILLISFNLFPLFWFRKYYLPYSIETSNIISNGNTQNRIIDKFKISKREWEVIELILQGKSNKEIEESLFISFHTVKNHIYSIYQKLGVKSRAALIHFILAEQRK